jgi:hypothetical protein
MLLSLQGFHARLPVPNTVVHKPVVKTLDINTGLEHHFSLLLIGGVWMMHVIHQPSLEILDHMGG